MISPREPVLRGHFVGGLLPHPVAAEMSGLAAFSAASVAI